ncbi:hypothetical protein B0J13DRAFT_212875 [Dactylonectria estremocensis]|uniref:MARVEL domain-containing protein n=1 Tax=Dactylonectria estremocensis TaxID=1079267 RepID=A0A9P9J775_9HYPO|nr:hypothetical protein B0J13DRAFT_212875 [Dactylonectria estremocensis]
MAREWHPLAVAEISLRSAQFLFACISAALCAVDLANWSSANAHADPNWIYVEFVAVVSVFSSIAQWWFALPRVAASIWDSVAFLLWLVAVAIFGQILSARPGREGGYSTGRLTASVSIDALNMVLWFASAVEACLCCGSRQHLEKKKRLEMSGYTEDFASESEKMPEEQPPSYESQLKVV